MKMYSFSLVYAKAFKKNYLNLTVCFRDETLLKSLCGWWPTDQDSVKIYV